jgi:hypothetical protein
MPGKLRHVHAISCAGKPVCQVAYLERRSSKPVDEKKSLISPDKANASVDQCTRRFSRPLLVSWVGGFGIGNCRPILVQEPRRQSRCHVIEVGERSVR